MTYIPTIGTSRLANDAVTSAKILDGTVTSGDIADGTVVNADIAAGAAIVYSKLSLTGSIVNADVAAGAAIAYSKLNLASSIVSADIVDGTIVNGDISGSAAIAYSKLALSNSIVSADIVNGTIVAADTAISLAQLAAQTASAGDITASSQKITNLANGTASGDAVNKGQLDAAVLGLVDFKASARSVSTSNITLSGAQTIDGVSVIAGDRVLVAGQTTGADNGIYVAAAGAWSRATDADASAEVTAGMYLAVEEGTTYGDTVWLLTTNNPITLGTTSLTFSQLPSLANLIAGNGLTKTGNQLDVGAGTGITVAADTVGIDTAVVPRMAVANTFTANNTFAGINLDTKTKTANYTVDVTLDHTILADSTGGAFTVTLPASHTAGDTVVVKDSGGLAATNNITVATADADTIDGSASDIVIANPYESYEFRSNGTNWFIV